MAVMVLGIALLLLSSICLVDVDAWLITPPTNKKDWQQIASLVVESFDTPSTEASALEKITWNVMGRSLSEDSTYIQYVSTARKMKGTKYAILVAKQDNQVIGMAELGVNRGNDNEGDRRATIGVLCVDAKYQKQGVGNELVQKCQKLAMEVWNKHALYAEVEPCNQGAISFFESCGFENKQGTEVMVSLRRGGRRLEERPHLLLSYNLTVGSLSLLANETMV
jgi:ribosomal protein S18 acetylase RimI-like enzyme